MLSGPLVMVARDQDSQFILLSLSAEEIGFDLGSGSSWLQIETAGLFTEGQKVRSHLSERMRMLSRAQAFGC